MTKLASLPPAIRSGDAEPSPAPRTTGYAWYVACMLSLAFLLSILDRYLLSVVIEDIKSNLSLTDTQLGILLGPSFVFMFVIASLPFGWLADAANRKLTIVGGMLCWSLATAWCGMAETFTELFMARLLVGFGEAALLPSALSLITAYFTRDKLSRGIAIFSMGSSFGRATAFAGGGLLFTWFTVNAGLSVMGYFHFAPWQGVFLTAGLIGLAFALLFLLTIREPVRTASTREKPGLKEGFALFWRQRWAYLAIFMPYGMTAAMGALMAGWSVAFYTRNHDLDVATASSLVGLTGLIFGPAGHLLGGWINDHLRGRGVIGAQPYVMAASLSTAAAMASIFALAPSVSLAAVAYGFSYGLLCASGPTGFGGIQLPTPERQRGVISSIFLLVYNALGNGLGPLLVGVIGDEFFPGSDQLGYAITASLALVLAVGLPFAIFGRPAFARAVRAREEIDGQA
jgi:MFS family permease